MDPMLLILIALTDGAKTAIELLRILQENTRTYSEPDALLRDLEILTTPSPVDGLAVSPIRKRADDRFELTTEGSVWLSSRPVIRFIVDRMNRVERHGVPRGESIPASRD